MSQANPRGPMLDGERIMAYINQNGNVSRPLTPRQQRRRLHKANKHTMPNAGLLREARRYH